MLRLHAWWRASAAMLGDAAGEELAARLGQVRRLTARAIAGEPTHAAGFDALGIVAADCGFSCAQTDDVITGLALDAANWRPANATELLGYAYHVAGAPGVLVMRAMGIAADDGEMLDCGCDGGVALVLGRLAGDLAKSVPNTSWLLPGDWLAQAGIGTEQLLLPVHQGLRQAFAARLRMLAAPYALSARYGAAHLPFRCRWAAATLMSAGVRGRMADRLSGLLQAMRHGPDETQVPLPRAALARVIDPTMWQRPADAVAETAVPAH